MLARMYRNENSWDTTRGNVAIWECSNLPVFIEIMYENDTVVSLLRLLF